MGNKYNSLTDTVRLLLSPAYTLTLAGGAGNTAVTFANSGSGSPFVAANMTGYQTSGGSLSQLFDYRDRTARVVRAALFCNFADGFLWMDADGPPNLCFQLGKLTNALSNSTSLVIPFPALNSWFEVDKPLPLNSNLAATDDMYLVCGRPAALSPEITLKTNSIGTEWDATTAYFYAELEIEHTFPMKASS